MKENNNLLRVGKTIQNDAWVSHGKFEAVVAFDDFAYKSLFKVIFFAYSTT